VKANSNGVETNSKNKDIRALDRDIHNFKNVYQAITNVVTDENGDRFADSHSILLRCKNHFPYLPEVQGVIMLDRLKYMQQNH
jgi:hypothetical protein